MRMNADGPTRVVIVGAAGRMGREAMKALDCPPEFVVAGGVVRSGGDSNSGFDTDLGTVLARVKPAVVVDLSHHSVALEHARLATGAGAGVVVGCTGLGDDVLTSIDGLASSAGVGTIYAPNFAIGAVLMMRFAEMAARWMPDAEIVEMHHERKEDAPSGTAMLTAQLMAAARGGAPTPMPKPFLKLEGARGGEFEGIHVHSLRLPGLLAHQEVLLGAPGEVLTIRHDAMDRSVYMGGLKLCVRRVLGLRGLTVGLDKLLFDD